MSKKILVTGANGFLGSAITKLALKKGFNVKVFDKYNSDNKWGWLDHSKIKNELEVELGDIRDFDSIHDAVKSSEVIFHVAADYRLWARKKSEIYSSNVFGTENIALKVLELNKKLIYTSSVATLSLKKDQLSDETFEPTLKEIQGDYKNQSFLLN